MQRLALFAQLKLWLSSPEKPLKPKMVLRDLGRVTICAFVVPVNPELLMK